VGGTARPSRSRSGAHQKTGNHSSQMYLSRPFSGRFDSSGVSERGGTWSGFMSATLSNSCGRGWSARRDDDRLLECFLGVAAVSHRILTFPTRHRIRPPVAKPTVLPMSIVALLVSPPRRGHHLAPHVLSHVTGFRAPSSTSPSTVSSAATLVPFERESPAVFCGWPNVSDPWCICVRRECNCWVQAALSPVTGGLHCSCFYSIEGDWKGNCCEATREKDGE